MSDVRPPRVVVLAGPNGAGKSSAAPALLAERVGAVEFVNADIIAADLAPHDPQSVAIEAGRTMLRRVGDLVATGADFAIETTLSGRSMQRMFVTFTAAAYDVELHYFWLPSVDMSLNRVRRRVQLGGHDIPAADIRRRFPRSVENFYWIYRPMATQWFAYDASAPGSRRRIAQGRGIWPDIVHDPERWGTIQRQAGDSGMKTTPPPRVREAVSSYDQIDAAIARADRETILRHRKAGVPLVLWRDGKVVEVDANTVPLPEVRDLAPNPAL